MQQVCVKKCSKKKVCTRRVLIYEVLIYGLMKYDFNYLFFFLLILAEKLKRILFLQTSVRRFGGVDAAYRARV